MNTCVSTNLYCSTLRIHTTQKYITYKYLHVWVDTNLCVCNVHILHQIQSTYNYLHERMNTPCVSEWTCAVYIQNIYIIHVLIHVFQIQNIHMSIHTYPYTCIYKQTYVHIYTLNIHAYEYVHLPFWRDQWLKCHVLKVRAHSFWTTFSSRQYQPCPDWLSKYVYTYEYTHIHVYGYTYI